ncbi:MAG: DNA primase [Williamsia sp.]|nr:DNA primase [Williamsia sp.]
MISQQTIQEIISRIDIVEIVGGFVKLKKRGTNYLGLCPFHNEKSPSFTVSPAKEIYKCFGCGRSGNSISFLMEHEKFSYVEALRWLAAKYNITVEETELSPEAKQQNQAAESLLIINQFAQNFFSQTLFDTEQGKNIGLAYLRERGFTDETMKKFGLGYCLEEKAAFAQEAVRQQYSRDALIRSGLVALRNEELVDNYRGRIIFPVHNNSGKVIGFGARVIRSNDKAPKYINTPENEVYNKSKILYGTYQARHAIDKNDECLLVEGYTDVLSLHQAGIENVVASGGTSLTQDQLKLIKKYTNHLTILYDGDAAGIKAALRGMDMALEESLDVKMALIPDKEDPDSFVRKRGAVAFREFIAANKKDFVLFQLDIALKEAGGDTAKRAAVVNQVAETISRINKSEDFTKQQDYIRQSAALLKIDENGFNALVNKYIRERIGKQELKQQQAVPQAPVETMPADNFPTDLSEESFNLLHQDALQEQAIVRVLLECGLKPFDTGRTVADYIFEEQIDDDLFEDAHLLSIIQIYKDLYEKGEKPTVRHFIHSKDNDIAQAAITVTNFPYEYSPKWNERSNTQSVNRKLWEYDWEHLRKFMLQDGKINPEIYNNKQDDDYKIEVDKVLTFLKFKKIRKLILLNQEDMQQTRPEHEMLTIIQTHNHLKKMQQELDKKRGMVIYPF